MFCESEIFPDCYFDILKAGPAQAPTTLWVGKGVLATLGRRFNGSEEDIGMNDLHQPTSLTVVRIARCGARDLADEEEHWIF
jgi:hypothetical protein